MNNLMNVLSSDEWGLGLTSERPLLISGPCSAETEEQVMQSCLGVAKQGAQILRAGIWKPRTRPNSFEGVGSIGLKWLKQAGKATNLPVCVEVANARHVFEALKNQIDVLWIGARTTVNPFAVQEIADALSGVDIPVMVKNPVNPDLELWIGGMERIYNAGINKIAAIHRGFSVYKSTEYRNDPQWEIPIELQRRIPGLEIICDPSHICGRRDTLLAVSQKAMDLNFDGLMLESHIDPDVALSDAKQQVTPSGLGEIMNQLVLRREQIDNPVFESQLEDLRTQIDGLDAEAIEVLAKRMEIAREIGLYKKENGVAILQMARWDEIFKSRMKRFLEKGLTEKFAKDLLTGIHKESIRQQTKVMNETIVKP